MYEYDTVPGMKKICFQISCHSRSRDLSRDTNCGTVYKHCCVPVADGYRLSGLKCDDTSGWIRWHNHTLAGQ